MFHALRTFVFLDNYCISSSELVVGTLRAQSMTRYIDILQQNINIWTNNKENASCPPKESNKNLKY
jgi:hypothetical protein